MIQPLFKNILVRETEVNKKIGSLFAPEGAMKFDRGVILAVGEEVSNMKEGDTVLFSRRSAAEVYHMGKTYLCMNAGSIYGIEIPEEGAENILPLEKEAVEADYKVMELVDEPTEAVVEEDTPDIPTNHPLAAEEAAPPAGSAAVTQDPVRSTSDTSKAQTPRKTRKRSPKPEGRS